jgi:hypothetical protein
MLRWRVDIADDRVAVNELRRDVDLDPVPRHLISPQGQLA